MKRIFPFLFLWFPLFAFTQETERYSVHIGGPCMRCGEERMMNVLRNVNGVMRAKLDENTHSLIFLIDPFRTSYEEVLDVLVQNGYDANSQRADAFKKYDPCCDQPRAEQNGQGDTAGDEDDLNVEELLIEDEGEYEDPTEIEETEEPDDMEEEEEEEGNNDQGQDEAVEEENGIPVPPDNLN